MYLTRVHLNPTRVGAQRLLGSRQRMHATILGSFPPGSTFESAEGRVLWRLDRTPESLTLFISSPSRPDLTGMIEQAGWPTSERAWDTASTSSLIESLGTGQRWRFRVTVNPTRSIASAHGTRGRRAPHLTLDHQQTWFDERAPSWGFTVEDLEASVRDRGTDHFERRSDGTTRSVPVSFVTLDGVLCVSDVGLLRRSLGHGMGRAKAYGCGLMTLAPM